MKVLLLLALIGAAYAVPRGGLGGNKPIVGGEPTTVENYPFMTSMQYGIAGIIWFQACGGSLITETTVLSAAHCYYDDYPSEWRVLVGTSLPSSGGTTVYVRKLTIHDGYLPATMDYDVALVHLANPVTLSASVGLASIPGPNYNLPDDTALTVIGFGDLWSGGPKPSQLHHVEVKIINHEICAERYAYLKTQPLYRNWPDITENMLCSGILDVGGKDACQSDSGGPVAHNGNTIVGVTSWGYGCGDEFYPGVNALVNKFTDWILANANN